ATGEIRHSLPRVALYPFEYKDRRLMVRPGTDIDQYVTEETFSIHFYGRRMRALLLKQPDGLPRPRSVVGRLCQLHGIDPRKAPIARGPAAEADADAEEGAEA